MVHNNNIKTFEMLLKHLEIEDKHQKSLVPLSVAFIVKESKPLVENRSRKMHLPLKTPDLGKVLPRRKRLNVITVAGKGITLWIVPMYGCFHAIVANSLPQWIVDM